MLPTSIHDYIILPIKSLQDNYIWVIHNQERALVIDPGESRSVIDYLQSNNLKLDTILLTHSHQDHTAGVKLLEEYSGCKIIDSTSGKLVDQQIIKIDSFPDIQVIFTPGHTNEHVIYLFDEQHLFCGDLLFGLGCGRVFTENYHAAYTSLCKLKELTDTILCYPAHEYTMNNLRFTSQIDPSSTDYSNYADFLLMKLTSLQISLPTLLADELKYNLFLRCNDPHVMNLVQIASQQAINNEFDCFKQLRILRNNFK